MSGADLFEDGFPHSTPEGFRMGCRGRACPGLAENGITCVDATSRYHGDYGFRKKVDAGMSPAEIVAAEKAEVKAAPKPKPVKKPTAVPLSAEAEAASVEFEPDGVIEPAEREIPLEKHGTPKGYYLGCRLKDRCPGVKHVGKSCTTAVSEYQKRLKENRLNRAAAAGTGTDPVTPAIVKETPVEPLTDLPAGVVDAVVTHELVGVDQGGELCVCGHREKSLVEHLGALALAAVPSKVDEQEGAKRPEDEPAADEAPHDWRAEAESLRVRVLELEQLLAERPAGDSSAIATLTDGSRITVVVTLERAA